MQSGAHVVPPLLHLHSDAPNTDRSLSTPQPYPAVIRVQSRSCPLEVAMFAVGAAAVDGPPEVIVLEHHGREAARPSQRQTG